jgi:hypothetical protein
LVRFGTYHHTELMKQVESDESSHSKLKSVSYLGLLLPRSSNCCCCKFSRIRGRPLMKNQCFRQAPSFIRFSTPGAVAPRRTCVMSATAPLPPQSLFLFCNYLLDDDVTTVHLFSPSNPPILHTPSLLACSLHKINLLNPVLRQIAETSHQCGNRVGITTPPTLLICLKQRLSGELCIEHRMTVFSKKVKLSLCLIKHDFVPYEEMEVLKLKRCRDRGRLWKRRNEYVKSEHA